MLICILSDTHTFHAQVKIPQCDLLIHAGDFSNFGTKRQIEKFLVWFSALPASNKVLVAGNHDKELDEKLASVEEVSFLKEKIASLGVIYLENQEVVINDLKIYGTPVQPYFQNWAFNYADDSERFEYYSKIPSDVDILVTHSPPYGVLDLNYRNEHCGCPVLKEKVDEISPLIHVFGHIHEDRGTLQADDILYMNASVWNHFDGSIRLPYIVELDKQKNVIRSGEWGSRS